MADKRIPWRSQEFTPEVVSGLIPDGMNEFLHPDYPDLPYPDGINDVTWYRDPLVNNDEPGPNPDAHWPPGEADAWLFPYDPYYPPTA
ncbi:MAG TPA: hypothetical protein GX738_08120 [Firmicutes bacterium]|jgi:hypothetical protein|nr:hypothetical protein [Bacillota bacterium]